MNPSLFGILSQSSSGKTTFRPMWANDVAKARSLASALCGVANEIVIDVCQLR
jgi:hypothetical protein